MTGFGRDFGKNRWSEGGETAVGKRRSAGVCNPGQRGIAAAAAAALRR